VQRESEFEISAALEHVLSHAMSMQPCCRASLHGSAADKTTGLKTIRSACPAFVPMSGRPVSNNRRAWIWPWFDPGPAIIVVAWQLTFMVLKNLRLERHISRGMTAIGCVGQSPNQKNENRQHIPLLLSL
jgi:hypothetical protein